MISVLGALVLTVVVWMNVSAASNEEPPDLRAVEAAPETPTPAPATPPAPSEKQAPQASFREKGLEADAQRRKRFKEGLEKSRQKQQALEQEAQSNATSRNMVNRGESVAFPSGFEVTLHSYSSPVQADNDNEFFRWKPDAGKQFAIIDVEGCAGSSLGDERRSLDMMDFSLTMPNNTRVGPTYPSVVEPALSGTNLLPGECVRGLVTFQVPKGQRPSYVRFDQIWPEEIARWSLD